MSLLSSFFGNSSANKKGIATPLELVSRTAELASNPKEIDQLLDGVRSVTSRLQPGSSLSQEDEKTLLQIYLQLEEYLTTKEPLRSYKKDDLRARIGPDLREKLPE
jgi:hypothetical protein